MKVKLPIFIISIFALSLPNGFVFNYSFTEATTMSNSNYILQTKPLNESLHQSLEPATTPLETKQPIDTGYKISTGLEGSLDRFSFTLTNTYIDFGILSPTNPVKRSTIISVKDTRGYSVIVYENHALAIGDSDVFIPDTTCDDGACTEKDASLWNSVLAYGFGFRCDSIKEADCESEFLTSNGYKQFSDNSKKESPQIVMASKEKGGEPQAEITYKVNISNTQSFGTYTNAITYIAAPSL